MLAIWVVLGLLTALVAGNLWPEQRPFGETGDIAIAIVVSVLTGLVDWYILPLINIEGTVRFIAAIIEPPLVALFVLWLVRKVKKTPAE
jgi:uncharacterized membrane protein YeaQ/YmgE (transglycosylase-associated protein family)